MIPAMILLVALVVVILDRAQRFEDAVEGTFQNVSLPFQWPQ